MNTPHPCPVQVLVLLPQLSSNTQHPHLPFQQENVTSRVTSSVKPVSILSPLLCFLFINIAFLLQYLYFTQSYKGRGFPLTYHYMSRG